MATRSEVPALLSVVITTHNRPDGVAAAVASVQDVARGANTQEVEIVVVDDGSDDAAARRLDALRSDAVEVIHQPDAGLSAARVRGVAASHGRWVAFLDDDDVWLEPWARVIAQLDESGVGIVSGGARLVSAAGEELGVELPSARGPLFDDAVVQYLAGCFAIRRDVYERAGGYLPGLSISHQTELMMRCVTSCDHLGLRTVHLEEPVAAIERRDESARTWGDPRMLYDGVRWVMSRHLVRFARAHPEWADWEAMAAVNAARLGEARRAKMHAWRSARLEPRNPARWLRLLMLSSPLRSRRWPRDDRSRSGSPAHAAPLAHAASLRKTEWATLSTASDLCFLPWGYRENPPASADAHGTPFWGDPSINDVRFQDPVYRWARQLTQRRPTRVLDVGCGSGDKLVRRLSDVATEWMGVDQPSGITEAERRWGNGGESGTWFAADLSRPSVWEELAEFGADLVVCADVIEHLEDPHELLARLRATVRPGGRVLVSTPDRVRLEDRDPLGPPHNPRHIREWSAEEFRLLVESAGFGVERVRHLLPRAYSPTVTDVKRSVHRLLHRRAVPDRRSSMAFLLDPRTDARRGAG